MMTKEQILYPYYRQNKGGLDEWIDYEDALKCMDEYAKQQAIAFGEWKSRMYIEGIYRQKGMWFDHRGECVAETNEQLYELFLQSTKTV